MRKLTCDIATFRRIRSGKLLWALAGLLWLAVAYGGESVYPALRVDGPEELVSDSNVLGCRSVDGRPLGNDHPDTSARAFRDYSGVVHLIAGSRENFQWTGPTLNEVARRTCDRAVISKANPAPEAFDQYQWLAAVYTEDGKTVYGLTHHEYHGSLSFPECRDAHDHKGSWRMRCWYASVNLVVSRDGGKTFEPPDGKARPIAVLPYRFAADMNRAGLHSPTNIVKHPEDGNYYVMVYASAYREQPQGMCTMRATNLEKADWRAWGGKDFDVEFANPYRAQIDDPKRHVCTPVVSWVARSLTYNTRARAFLLIGHQRGRVVYAWSRDLIHWSEPATLMEVKEFALAVRERASEATAYYSALDPFSAGRSFDQTGERFFLYYTRFSDPVPRGERGWAFRTRQLVRRPVVVQ